MIPGKKLYYLIILPHTLKLKVFLTQSQSRLGAVQQAETPELCDASPTGRQCPPSWQTLGLQWRQASALRTKAHQGLCIHSHDSIQIKNNKDPKTNIISSWNLVIEFCVTSFVTVLECPCDPLNGFSSNFTAKVSIKRWWSSSLREGKEMFHLK